MISKKRKEGPIVKLRKVMRSGSYLYICLPREFVELHGIVQGERLPVLADHIMKVVPMKEE